MQQLVFFKMWQHVLSSSAQLEGQNEWGLSPCATKSSHIQVPSWSSWPTNPLGTHTQTHKGPHWVVLANTCACPRIESTLSCYYIAGREKSSAPVSSHFKSRQRWAKVSSCQTLSDPVKPRDPEGHECTLLEACVETSACRFTPPPLKKPI